MSHYILKLDATEVDAISQRARERGYTSVEDYLRALVAADALVEVLRSDWQDTDPGADQIETSFREAWHDATTENLLPIKTLWDVLDDAE